jgi:hypothetical protein
MRLHPFDDQGFLPTIRQYPMYSLRIARQATQGSDLLRPECVGKGCIVYIDNSLGEGRVNDDTPLAASDLSAVNYAEQVLQPGWSPNTGIIARGMRLSAATTVEQMPMLGAAAGLVETESSWGATLGARA